MSVVIIFIYSTCSRLVVLPSSELQASVFSFLFPVFFSLTICSRMSSSEIQSSVILARFDLGIVFVPSSNQKSQSNQDQNVFEMDQTLRGFNWGEIPFTFIFWRRSMPFLPQPQWVSLKRTNEGSSPIWRSHIFGDLETFLRNSRSCGSGTIRAQGIVVVREWKKIRMRCFSSLCSLALKKARRWGLHSYVSCYF